MSLSEQRILLHTNLLLQQYLQNGTLPDELLVQQQLQTEFAQYYDPITKSYNVDGPLWTPSDLTYRQTSNAGEWNQTQSLAAEDTQLAYTELLGDVNSLTSAMYKYLNRANLLKNRIANLVSRINNLLLLSTSTDGFIYSFFDNFVDSTKVDFSTLGRSTTALVNTATQDVQLPTTITTSITGAITTTSILNLLFLQPSQVSFSVLNPLVSQIGLSSAQLTDIFNNQATAWQQNITITGPGPLVCQLTVQIAPLEPVLINKITMNTKMSNYSNEILVQVLTSEDGVSYSEVQSGNNPQFIGPTANFSFTPTFASYVRFIITKNVPDSGQTYNVGLQYISFQQVTYALEADLYSIPITKPDSSPINKVAIEACTVKPNGTDINYFIIPLSGNPIPISLDTDTTPIFPKIVNIGALTNIEEPVIVSGSPFTWTPQAGGYSTVNVMDLANTNAINLLDSTIPNTLTLWRNLGGPVAAEPSGLAGWQSNPLAYPSGYFQTYMEINNVNGIQVNLGSNQVFLDNKQVTNAVTLTPGLHTFATTNFDQLQSLVSQNSDMYFAWNMQFKSTFEFYNNITPGDPSAFTYDSSTGNIIINALANIAIEPSVDFANSFVPSLNSDGTYQSNTTPISTSSFTAPAILNAGSSIAITVGPTPRWVNEIQLVINTNTPTAFTVSASLDNINWSTVLSNQSGPVNGANSFGSLKLPQPVYAKYINVSLIEGSNVSVVSGQVALFAPVFLNAGVIQTEKLYLPTGHIFKSLIDNLAINSAQTYNIYSGFNNAAITTLPNTGFSQSILTLYIPNIYLRVSSNNSDDPYVSNINFLSIPEPNEVTIIKFSYLAPGNINTANSIVFNAHFSSNQQGITPLLQSYRVKLL